VTELKDSETDEFSNYKTKLDKATYKGNYINDVKRTAIVATSKLRKAELEDPEEGEHLFRSQMWVKGSSVKFIIESRIQKNLISTEVVKRLKLPAMSHP